VAIIAGGSAVIGAAITDIQAAAVRRIEVKHGRR
jgi:hypothetical protein